MRVVLQRVQNASVEVEGRTTGTLGKGLLVFAGIGEEDTEDELRYIARKIVNLRIFEDEARKFNRSLLDIGGGLLVISQFTLYADCRKGRRPSFTGAAPPERAAAMFDHFIEILKEFEIEVETGVFQAMMDVTSCNYGPVTIIMDSRDMRR